MAKRLDTAAADSLILRVRGDFTLKGSSLNAWCRQNGIDRGHAYRVLKGLTNGPKAQALRHAIITASKSAA